MTDLHQAAAQVAEELQHLGQATCFELSDHGAHRLRELGFNAHVAGTRGHSFILVDGMIVDFWEKDGSVRAKVWPVGQVPQHEEPLAYEEATASLFLRLF